MSALDVASLMIAGAKATAAVTDVLTGIDLDAQAGAVAQLSLTLADPDRALLRDPGILVEGAAITWRRQVWQVAAATVRLGSDNTLEHRVDARSPLARALRKDVKTTARQGVSPSAWVTARVKAAGGKAICQPSNARGFIGQKGKTQRQTTLDVIADLAGDLGWSWVERDGLLVFASAFWAWESSFATATTWDIALTAEAVIEADLSIDADDRNAAATGGMSLAWQAASNIAPWDRIRLTGAGRYSGLWLVDGVKVSGDPSKPVQVELTQPRKPVARKVQS